MYTPAHFAIDDKKEISAFIREHGFGQLLTATAGRICSSYTPFHYDAEAGKLLCHLARINPQLEACDGQEVLVTLEGPHGYISPNWYHKPGVPTWNYQAVHLYGVAKRFDDAPRLAALVSTLSDHYEAQQANPWQPTYPKAMLNAIGGIEITLTEVQAKYKLSQNRSESDVESVCSELESRGEHALAAAMRAQLAHRAS